MAGDTDFDIDVDRGYEHRFYFMRTTHRGPPEFYFVRYEYSNQNPGMHERLAETTPREVIWKGVLPKESVRDHLDVLNALAVNANEGRMDEAGLEQRLAGISSALTGGRNN